MTGKQAARLDVIGLKPEGNARPVFYKRFHPGGQKQSGQSRKGIEQIAVWVEVRPIGTMTKLTLTGPPATP
jgi:hypothetical protein